MLLGQGKEPTMTTQTSIHQAIEALRGAIRGTVIIPGQEGYDDARAVHDFSHDRRPAAIVQPLTTEDVAEAVRFARSEGLPLAVKGGGHSLAGHSAVESALVIDLSQMRAVTIDTDAATALVQGGATSADLAGPAAANGFALSTGDTETVGLGGLVTGGGIGWMARKQGLTIDHVRAVRMVTASGEVVGASASEHPDLFWAIRGGGGNFGIVTEFEFDLPRVDLVHGGVVMLPATREVVRGYLEYAPRATEDLTTIAMLMAAPPAPFVPESLVGTLVLAVAVCVSDPAVADEALAPIRALATPLVDFVGTMPYPGMFALTEVPAMRHGAAVRSVFADTIADETIDAMIAQMQRSSSPFNQVQLRGLGGAIARVEPGATAFSHRDARYLVAVIGMWMDPADPGTAHRQWVQDLWPAVAKEGRGVYVNFLEDEGETRRRAAYSAETYRRLQSVKQAYDPENVFRFNQNIAPTR